MYEEDDDDVKTFDYCDKVDIHALDFRANLNTVVAIASEHGFRGIVVPMTRLSQLVKSIRNYGCKELIPVSVIDYPFGNLSTDIRTQSILSSKELGAKEIEIVAPYYAVADREFRQIQDDAQNISNNAKRCGLSVKYVLDQNSNFVDDTNRTKICRILQEARIPIVSTSLGFFDKNVDHAENIIKMRNIKSKTGCRMKVFINSQDVNDIASYVKAGADIIGLPWNMAPYLVHAYEEMVQKKG